MSSIQKAILKTLCYSDIFDYPLTAEEIWKYLMTNQQVTKQQVLSALKKEKKIFSSINHYYVLSGREAIVRQRKTRIAASKKKIEKVKRISYWLSKIPTIQFIGISGSVAMLNADTEDDIDLFMITSVQTLWITRLLVVCMLEVFGIRRKRTEKNEQDKLCLNFLLDESSLTFPKERHDLYTAHEIVQIQVLCERNNIYERLLGANKWVEKYMPNSIRKLKIKNEKLKVSNKVLSLVEPFARMLQLWYMEGHRTTEVTTQAVAAFHPVDYRGKILEQYKKRLLEMGIED